MRVEDRGARWRGEKPYRGSALMMSDLVGGQISMVFDATPTALPQARSGAIRAIGAGMATRMRAMPELPTLQEQGLAQLPACADDFLRAWRRSNR
jgi:tripartite-type tricarboxylate transporter receptor subunit TctC